MTTTTEKYIKKAIAEAKKELGGTSVSNCSINMDLQADGATQLLAEALLSQAKANQANSEAMGLLAKALKPIDICGIKITQDGIN